MITVREPDPLPASRSYPESGPLRPRCQESNRRSFGAHPSLEDNGNEHTVVSTDCCPGCAASRRAPGRLRSGTSRSTVSRRGPFSLAKAHERIRTERPRGKEMHCWKPGFFVWLPN